MKNISYNLARVISGGSEDNILLADEDDEVVDKDFTDFSTLSVFRRGLIILAVDQFVDAYGVERKSLGQKCKLFLQNLWNTLAWRWR